MMTFHWSKSKVIIAAACLVVVLGAGAFLWMHNAEEPAKPTEIVTGDGKISLTPPTPIEKQETEDHKDDLVKQQATPPPPTTPGSEKRAVNPVIVDASQYDQSIEVRAYAPVVENGGTCTVTFTYGNNTVSRQVEAIADASTTRCTNLEVPREDFATAGSWKVVVAYSSASSQGSVSGAVEVK